MWYGSLLELSNTFVMIFIQFVKSLLLLFLSSLLAELKLFGKVYRIIASNFLVRCRGGL